MPLLITEIAIQADGPWAFELTNTDAIDLTGLQNTLGFQFTDSAGTTAGAGFNFFTGFTGTIAAGESVTFGHPDVAGVDFPVSGNPDIFDASMRDVAGLLLNLSPGINTLDTFGVRTGGTNLPLDASFQSLTTRAPDTDFNSDNSGDFTQTSFAGNTLGSAVCFLGGTLIATPAGEVPVEALRIGDLVCTDGRAAVPVKWLGRQTLRKLRHGPKRQPVRISAGALGGGLPHSDLTVTADHGMVMSGYVVNAAALVNGATIDFVPMAELEPRVCVYHIETEAHEVILANGAPAETFIDYVDRAAFDNYQEYLDLYGAERIIREAPMPRISAARLVPEPIRARLGLPRTTAKVA